MNNEVLSACSLNKYFHDPEPFHVLKDLNLTVNRAEFVTLIGKSGCGKSTLLYLLSTLDTDYTGNITIQGTHVTGKNQDDLAQFRNRHIGFVFQFHFLLPEFTALENVMMPALKLGRHSKEQIRSQALEKLAQMGMDGFSNRIASKLSGGQQQRVAIARALINDPVLIMADEPTGNLDSSNTAIVLEIFQELSRRGNTIIAVTHDQDFARRADRVIEMVDGKIV